MTSVWWTGPSGAGALAVSVRCLGMLEWKTALNDSVHTTSKLSWVLIDTSLFQVTRFWSGMRQAEAIRISSLCVSQTSKYHLGGFSFALWSLAVRREAGLRRRHWQELSGAFSLLVFLKEDNAETEFVMWRSVQAQSPLVLLISLC